MSNREIKKYNMKLKETKEQAMRDMNLSEDEFDKFLDKYMTARANNRELTRIFQKTSDGKVMKLGKQILKTGSVVKLHLEEDMQETYDPQLKKLVEGNHRFVIGIHFGIRGNSVPIHLLSTSKKANEDYRNGCKLIGDYTKFDKDVYLDMNTIWFVKRNCIKSYEYQLEDADRGTLELIFVDRNFASVECKLGITSSELLNEELHEYKLLISKSDRDRQEQSEGWKKSYRDLLEQEFGSYIKCKNMIDLYGMPGHTDESTYEIAKILIDMADVVNDMDMKNSIIQDQLDFMANVIPDELVQKHEINVRRGYKYIDKSEFEKFENEEYIVQCTEEAKSKELNNLIEKIQKDAVQYLPKDMPTKDKVEIIDFIKEDMLKEKGSIILSYAKEKMKTKDLNVNAN